jgi:hypothetical protein
VAANSTCVTGAERHLARYLCHGEYESGGSYRLGFGAATRSIAASPPRSCACSPLGIETSAEATRQLESAHEAWRGLLGKQLEQAGYEARRAFEQYDEVDARNRLVAAELEARWNQKLATWTRSRARSRSSRPGDACSVGSRARGTALARNALPRRLG